MSGLIVDELIERFRAWAERASDVLALAIIGSRARARDPADEWSDVDLVIVTDNADRYLRDGGWLDEIGRCRLTFVEESPLAGLFERRAHFEGGVEFDLLLITAAMVELAAGLPEVADLVSRGWRVLVDKQDLTTSFTAQVEAQPVGAEATATRPSPADITDAAARFWHGCIWSARKLRRGELWMATVAVNCGLHQQLLHALEWEAQSRPAGNATDVWFRGRFLERWADPKAVGRLDTTFARYDRDAVAASIRALAAMYSEVISEVATRVGTDPPRSIESYGSDVLRSVLGE